MNKTDTNMTPAPLPPFERHCWAEVDLDALAQNLAAVRRRVGKTPVCAVVKAAAYGHGDGAIARCLAGLGVRHFAVSCLAEALRLRRQGITGGILVLGYTAPGEAAALAGHRITQAVMSLSYAKALSTAAAAAGVTVRCHLKADTGMGRLGFTAKADLDAALDEMEEALRLPGLWFTGLFQHFASADEPDAESVGYTEAQHALFLQLRDALAARGHRFGCVHCCNSAAQIAHPEWGMDMVRAGILLYGYDPAEAAPAGGASVGAGTAFAGAGEAESAGLAPVLRLKTVVAQVKELPAGESVSYGRIWTAPGPRRVATVAVGYADGYPRALSNRGVMELHGKPAPVIGRVCMDQTVLDVTGIPEARPGDEVTVFGPGGIADSAAAAARKADTIPYEILCGVSMRAPRIYLHEGRPVEVWTPLAP